MFLGLLAAHDVTDPPVVTADGRLPPDQAPLRTGFRHQKHPFRTKKARTTWASCRRVWLCTLLGYYSQLCSLDSTVPSVFR